MIYVVSVYMLNLHVFILATLQIPQKSNSCITLLEIRSHVERKKKTKMGRGVSAGGGRSSLGYLFGDGESANKAQNSQSQNPLDPAINTNTNTNTNLNLNGEVSKRKWKATIDPQIPAGIQGSLTNNYFRVDGQNCGNFITDRPSTKVHAEPGGGSSLGYLFGGN